MKITILGGLGFIGFNNFLFLSKKHKIQIIDNFSGKSSRMNFKTLLNNYPRQSVQNFNIKNYNLLFKKLSQFKPDAILFAAGQIAVTKSIKNPREDFESTFLGAFNTLECLRNKLPKTKLIYLSSNKVYGNLDNIKLKETSKKYINLGKNINEKSHLNFKSPYGCSKGSSDQYVSDYSSTYGLNTVVLRLSCIYGPNQWGTEDQGWISWFIIKALKRDRINIFGNGKQVRDVLYIDDLVKLINKCIITKKLNGDAYNVGGGATNSLSLLNLIDALKIITKNDIKYKLYKSRIGDQKYFVNDLNKVKKKFGWYPKVSSKKGVRLFFSWIQKNINF
jgi:CDP-paratose 2-epimerase